MPRARAFDGQRQQASLRSHLVREPHGLQTRSGKSLTEVAHAVGLSYGQFWRYLNGDLPLRSDQFEAFAAALETTEGDLLRACFPTITLTESGPSMRDLLEQGGMPADEIQSFLSSWGSMPSTLEQRERIARFLIDASHKRKAPNRRRA